MKKRIDSSQQFNYKNALTLMKDTFDKSNPDGNFIVQTDETTNLPFETFRSNLNGINLMEAIVLSHLNVVSKNLGKLILVGCDHLIPGNLEKIFEDDFDIATCIIGDTFDDQHRTNIINLVFVKNQNTKKQKQIIKFFQEQHNIFLNLPESDRLWWGDQKSLSLLLETKNIISEYYASNGKTNIFNFNKLKIKLFQYGGDQIVSSTNLQSINEKNLIIDFAGNKINFNHVYDKIMEK
ncbi:hypothetical protein [Winogradskyella sp.]|uniref:hypothetical protein n=1 Tax=Winogradskyella sp. TaxID=1883156 RepID=UPI003F699FC4